MHPVLAAIAPQVLWATAAIVLALALAVVAGAFYQYTRQGHAAFEKLSQEMESRIAERTKQLEEVQSDRDRFFDMAGDMLCIFHDDGWFFDLNAAWHTHTGWNRGDLRAHSIQEFTHPDDQIRVAQLLEDMRLRAGAGTMQFRFRCKSGDYRTLEWNLIRDTATGRTHGAARDVTAERAMTQAMAEAKEAAEQTARAQKAFLASMSHEIRTPLNAIIGTANLLVDTDIDEHQKELLRIVEQGGDHLMTLLNDVLDLSKLEAGGLELDEAPFHLRECIETSCDIMAPAAAGKNIELAYDIRDAPRWVLGDATRLRQILVNLIGNAVKFTSEGEVFVLAQGDGDKIRFSVRDTGIGIPPDRMDTIFSPFKQADEHITHRYGGTGLGLAICKNIIEAMGSTIEVESVVGKGTTMAFTVSLPEAHEGPPAPWELPSVQLEGRKVLIVDDNATNLRILDHHLRTWKLEVTATSGPREALEALGSLKPDLVLLDQNMPIMDGSELAGEIAKRVEAPMVLITSTMVTRVELGTAGDLFHSVVHKPVRPAILYDAILDALTDRAADKREATVPDDMAAMAPLRILVAEDNRVNQKVIGLLLRRMGYEPTIVTSGRQAITAFIDSQYDVVLMDINMDDIDGLRATREIRNSLPEGVQPHIIAMTAHAGPEDRRACEEAGMDDYLSKPVSIAALTQALRRIHAARGDGQRVRRPSVE